MSVVNKMLKDLEARQAQTDEIHADYLPPQKQQSKLLVLALLILSVAAILFALSDKNQLFTENKSTEVTTAVNTQPVSAAAVIKKMTVVTKKAQLQEQIPSQITSTQSPVANIGLVTTEAYIASKSNVQADTKTLPNELEVAARNKASLQVINTQDKQLETQAGIELKSQAAPEKTSSFSMTGSSQENKTSSLKQRIAESLNDDNLDLARSLLHTLLETEPDNIKARKKLASLHFAQGNYTQSKQLLVRGIELHPAKSDLRLMLARLFMVQKESSQAMKTLTEFQPSGDNQTEYLAYRAALAQQFKQTMLAKSDYQTLTNIESDNAKWWLGLAIAEDQLGEMNLALQAYNRASSLGQLDRSVHEFIQQRITILTGAK
jgi:MSHA biogenesis protein MshN